MTADQLRTEYFELQTRRTLAVGTPAWGTLYEQCIAKQQELRKVVTMEQRIANCGRVADCAY